jgi:integrase
VWGNKADLPRTLPMTRRVRSIVERRMEGLEQTDRPFPFDNWWPRPMWQRLREVMELENDDQFTPHYLRRTCASRLVQRGVGITVVKEWLGHKTLAVTIATPSWPQRTCSTQSRCSKRNKTRSPGASGE